MTTEEALIQAALENWKERDVKLRLADHLRESGEEGKANWLEFLSNFEWVSLPDSQFPEKLRHFLKWDKISIAAVLPTNKLNLYHLFADSGKKFYSGDCNTPEEGIDIINRFFLGATGTFTDMGEAYTNILKYADPL